MDRDLFLACLEDLRSYEHNLAFYGDNDPLSKEVSEYFKKSIIGGLPEKLIKLLVDNFFLDYAEKYEEVISIFTKEGEVSISDYEGKKRTFKSSQQIYDYMKKVDEKIHGIYGL